MSENRSPSRNDQEIVKDVRRWLDDPKDKYSVETRDLRRVCWLAEQFLTRSEIVPSEWKPYPAEKPEPDGDARHLVVLVNGDVHWVGIRSYDFIRDCWHGRGNCGDSPEEVWYFKPLLGEGERLPPIPNAREQICGEGGYPPELRWARTTR